MHKKHLQFVAIGALESTFAKKRITQKDVIPVRPVNFEGRTPKLAPEPGKRGGVARILAFSRPPTHTF
jgi:hypothetical protein